MSVESFLLVLALVILYAAPGPSGLPPRPQVNPRLVLDPVHQSTESLRAQESHSGGEEADDAKNGRGQFQVPAASVPGHS